MNTIRIWFEKRGEASYISLLDLQRVMQRVMKRSGLPVWYTLGFNPHIYMTFTCPLSLGQESLCESVDVKTEEEHPDLGHWQQRLNAYLPAGIKVFRVEPAGMKAEKIGFAEYALSYPVTAKAALEAYNACESAVVEKKGKKGPKPIELKQYIPAVAYTQEAERLRFTLRLSASQELTLNPSLLCGFLEKNYGVPACDAEILRTALFTQEGEPFV